MIGLLLTSRSIFLRHHTNRLMDGRVSAALVFFNALAIQLIKHVMTLHSNFLHLYITVVSSNVPLAEQEMQISYVPSQSPESTPTAFWYLPPLVISHLPFRRGKPWLLIHNLASDITAGAPAWPHLEDRKVLEPLEVLGPCSWSPAAPRIHTRLEHSLRHQGLNSHHWCSYKISF